MKIIPIGDRILVEPEAMQEQVGGIHLPDQSKKTARQGTVVELGIEAANKDIRKGDKVMLAQFGGMELNVNEKKYVVLHVDDVACVLR
jgi:chaperonin GroES